jgi:RHS repeat-associated protein
MSSNRPDGGLHGDVVAAASLTATSPTRTFANDEFGVPIQYDGTKFAWLGGKGRRTELASGVVQMGVRSYVPQLGRFLQTDPVPGGSANAYDYAGQDPVNAFDLDGERCKKSRRATSCRKTTRFHGCDVKGRRIVHRFRAPKSAPLGSGGCAAQAESRSDGA